MKQPTAKQLETLQAIREFISAKGYSPTIAELAKLAGIRGFAMQQRIEGLERKSLITRTARISRSIRPDMGNCDLCWKKSEDKIYRAIMANPSRVIWWSGTEERFGQVFRQDRPKYAHMAWYAERMATQDAFDFDAAGLVSEDIDCFCGD